jgi:hypothetical protein
MRLAEREVLTEADAADCCSVAQAATPRPLLHEPPASQKEEPDAAGGKPAGGPLTLV